MSALEFLRTTVPGPELHRLIDQRQDIPRNSDLVRSRVALLGEEITQAARNGLRALAYVRETRNTSVITPEQEEASATDFASEYGALLLGHSLISIEQTLVDGFFDYGYFLNNITVDSIGTRGYRYTADPQYKIQRLSPSQLAHMRTVATLEPTFVIFFDAGQRNKLLPSFLRGYLEKREPVTGEPRFELIQPHLGHYFELANEVRGVREPVPEHLQGEFPNGIPHLDDPLPRR